MCSWCSHVGPCSDAHHEQKATGDVHTLCAHSRSPQKTLKPTWGQQGCASNPVTVTVCKQGTYKATVHASAERRSRDNEKHPHRPGRLCPNPPGAVRRLWHTPTSKNTKEGLGTCSNPGGGPPATTLSFELTELAGAIPAPGGIRALRCLQICLILPCHSGR
jgi:hypothetical protein